MKTFSLLLLSSLMFFVIGCTSTGVGKNNRFVASDSKAIKTCNTLIPQLIGEDEDIAVKIEVFANRDEVTSKVTQLGESAWLPVSVVLHSVRPNLPNLNDPKFGSFKLNDAEKLVSHAQMMLADPIFEGKMSVGGFDLKKVRSAKVYAVGEGADIGLSSVVEARDGNGKVLGTFFGGFYVTPCE